MAGITDEHFQSRFYDFLKMAFQKELSQASDISALSSCFCYWLPILSPIFEKYCCNFENAIKLLQVSILGNFRDILG